MKKFLYILYFPVKLIISIFINFLTFLVSISSGILYIFMLLSIVGAIAAFINHETKYGIFALIFALIFAFLISPIGLPLFLAKVLAFISVLNERTSEMLAD